MTSEEQYQPLSCTRLAMVLDYLLFRRSLENRSFSETPHGPTSFLCLALFLPQHNYLFSKRTVPWKTVLHSRLK